VNSSFVSDTLRERHDDIIWRIRLDKKWLYLYLLIEFQSSIDDFMAVRIMVYVGLLYQHLIETQKLTAKDKLERSKGKGERVTVGYLQWYSSLGCREGYW
jgi:predicted transposase YdaD